jgi:hypothetical protein
MFPRLTTAHFVVAIIVLAALSATFRVYTAPERIQKHLATAKQVCDQSGGRWTVDDRNAPICQRD